MLPITAETMSILERPSSRAEMDLVFTAEIPALGLSTFFIQKKKEDTVDKYSKHSNCKGIVTISLHYVHSSDFNSKAYTSKYFTTSL